MTTALQVVQIIFQSVAIIFMICFMFIGIWSFIAFLKMAKNQNLIMNPNKISGVCGR